MAQVVESLPSKCEAQSSIPSTTNKRKKVYYRKWFKISHWYEFSYIHAFNRVRQSNEVHRQALGLGSLD
jgi:hypothetical protein